MKPSYALRSHHCFYISSRNATHDHLGRRPVLNQARGWVLGALADKHPLWPLAEHNQGTLTFLALAAAFAIAVYEVGRAARSEQRALIEYIDFVLGIADHAIENCRNAIATIDGEAKLIEETPLVIWDFQQSGDLAALREVLSVIPPYPHLKRAVGALDRTLSVNSKHQIVSRREDKREALVTVIRMIETSRLWIERARPASPMRRAQRSVVALFSQLLKRRAHYGR